MKSEQFTRLVEMIKADPRSDRAISLEAKCGQNYISEMIREEKEPTLDRLRRILDVLGDEASIYVMSGIRADSESLRLLKMIQDMKPETRSRARSFFESLTENQEPPPAAEE